MGLSRSQHQSDGPPFGINECLELVGQDTTGMSDNTAIIVISFLKPRPAGGLGHGQRRSR